MLKIALSAGHHNLSGGHATEIALVGPITAAIAEQCRALDMDVRVITPNNGLGTFPGGLRQVAQTVVDWAAAGWVADVFLEVHAEHNGSGDRGRGCFVIYPDAGADVDEAVRDTLGPAIATAIREATGIPLRGRGVMSEQHTHVATSLHSRLGIFQITAPLHAPCRRMIVEVGAYSSPSDLKMMRRKTFPAQVGQAIARVLAGLDQPDEQADRRWYQVVVDAARTRQGPGTHFPVALQGEATLRRDEVFAGNELVAGEEIAGDRRWVHRADGIGFVSMALLKDVTK